MKTLTTREKKILNLLLQEREQNEISEILGVKPKTVKADIERIQDKWGVVSFTGLIIEACINGHIPNKDTYSVSSQTLKYEFDALNAVQVPERYFAKTNHLSFDVLVKRSGYLKRHREIDEFLIRHILLKNPKYVRLWSKLSKKNLRVTWFVKQKRNGVYLVGCHDPNICSAVFEYSDELSCYASFIRKELESIRLNS